GRGAGPTRPGGRAERGPRRGGARRDAELEPAVALDGALAAATRGRRPGGETREVAREHRRGGGCSASEEQNGGAHPQHLEGERSGPRHEEAAPQERAHATLHCAIIRRSVVPAATTTSTTAANATCVGPSGRSARYAR